MTAVQYFTAIKKLGLELEEQLKSSGCKFALGEPTTGCDKSPQQIAEALPYQATTGTGGLMIEVSASLDAEQNMEFQFVQVQLKSYEKT